MAIQQLSPNSVAANPAYVNPQAKADRASAAAQANQAAQKAIQVIKTDTVTISEQALQKLADERDIAAQEMKESSAERAREALKDKRR